AIAATCTRSYTVKEGDICDEISAANNVSTYQLAVVNPSINSDCSNLVPGSSLCLGYANEDCADTYVVQPDDTCEDLTSSHGLNSTVLYLNNPQLDSACDNLYIGEVICTAKTVQVPAAPANGIIPGTSIPATAYPASPTDGDQLPWCDEI
ncbi:hypothetical protein BV25DRAFT_1814505, partial [Artomyces pyxidatus]